MELDSRVRPVWQLPVHAAEQTGNSYIPANAKYHCFVNGASLCGKHTQCTEFYDEGISIESGIAAMDPTITCKWCRKAWLGKYDIEK